MAESNYDRKGAEPMIDLIAEGIGIHFAPLLSPGLFVGAAGATALLVSGLGARAVEGWEAIGQGRRSLRAE